VLKNNWWGRETQTCTPKDLGEAVKCGIEGARRAVEKGGAKKALLQLTTHIF